MSGPNNSTKRYWIARAGQPLRGSVRVPGDKSVSHRAVMLGALAEGVTHVRGFLEGEDTRATARVFEQLGVRIETPSASERIVHGVGLHGLRAATRRWIAATPAPACACSRARSRDRRSTAR